MIRLFLISAFIFSGIQWSCAQVPQQNGDTTTYHLIIKKETVNKAGKDVMAMTINGNLPGPTLHFKEGDFAVIYVENLMDVATSVHWHGILVPNYYDGVPYLTTPPIMPGTTFKYEFPIVQSGTYWYHSHTMLQEQSGVFGSIQIDPKKKTLDYDSDLILVLSDWTNEQPKNVMRNLKRGNEWYGIKKGTSTPLSKVIAQGGFGAQLNFWKQRMEGADIADIYYNAFLINGEQHPDYPEFKPGEKVRLRIINGSSSSQFWLTFGGQEPLLVSADGINVVPLKHNKTFIAVAETYDFIITIPEKGKIELRAMVQDGSGSTSAYFGQGDTLHAAVLDKPDKIDMMKKMAKMDMRMGAPATSWTPNNPKPEKMMHKWGMQMDDMNGMDAMDDMKGMDHSKMNHGQKIDKPDSMKMENGKMDNHDEMKMDGMDDMDDMKGMDHSKMNHGQKIDKPDSMKMENGKMDNHDEMKMDGMDNMDGMDDMKGMDHSKMNHGQKIDKPDSMKMENGKMDNHDEMKMDGMDMFAEYNYDYLKSPVKTSFDKDRPRKDVILNLTGNMWRYIWSMNGVPLTEADNIKINKGEVVRFTLNNLTMMHHPMHLHGHFFRVLNENGEYSPLKHTVNVAPMQKVVIEFDANEYGDWFFHCHVLYHMMGGMSRVISYDTIRDPRMKPYSLKKLKQEGNHFYTWGTVDISSQMGELELVSSNTRNMFKLKAEYGWNQNLEGEFTYERFLYDYFRVFGGVNVENEIDKSYDQLNTTAIIGIRYFTPYMFDLDLRIDNELRPQISLSREFMLFPRTMLFGRYEYQFDMGWVNDLNAENPGGDVNFQDETTWSVGLKYLLSRNFSIMASYDNRFGAGGGLSVKF